LHQAAPPQQQAELELGGSVGWIEAKHTPEVGLGFTILLEPAQNGASQNQKLGLVRTPAQPLREYVNRVSRFLEPIQEAGQV
jgi:hypothetical protein